jgi:hypothetical protein
MYKHVKRATVWGSRPLRSVEFRKRENGGEEWTPDDKLPGRRGQPPRKMQVALRAAGCPVPAPSRITEHVPKVSNCAKTSFSGN